MTLPVWPQGLSWTFMWVMQTTWQASVLAIAVAAILRCLRDRLTARSRCLLWGIVVLRLIAPPLPESRWTVFRVAPPPVPAAAMPSSMVTPSIASTVSLVADMTPSLHAAPAHSGMDHRQQLAVAAEESARLSADRVRAADSSQDLLPKAQSVPRLVHTFQLRLPQILAVGLGVWLAGAIWAMIRLLAAHMAQIRSIRRCVALNNPRLQSLAAECAAETGLNKAPRILVADHLPGPAVAGLFRPVLLLPSSVTADFSNGEIRLMLLHELAHVRRWDLPLSCLLSILKAVHWLNPVLRRAIDALRNECEIACDELVLAHNGPEVNRQTYGRMLLRLAEQLKSPEGARFRRPVGQMGIFDGTPTLYRRIAMIARSGPLGRPSLHSWSAIFAGIGLLSAGLLLADVTDPVATPATSKAQVVKDIAPAAQPIGAGTATSPPTTLPPTTLPSTTLRPTPRLDPSVEAKAAALDVQAAMLRMESAKITLESKKQEVARVQDLFRRQPVDPRALDIVNAEVQQAELQVQLAQLEVEKAKLNQSKAEAALKRRPVGVDYVIGPNDLLSLWMEGLPGDKERTTRVVRVSGTGNILLPRVGKVKAAGLTEAELSEWIPKVYREQQIANDLQVIATVIDEEDARLGQPMAEKAP